jgi:hypothetical protein
MDAMQSHFAHLQDISPISVGSITFGSARSPRFLKMRAVWLMAPRLPSAGVETAREIWLSVTLSNCR